MADAIWRIGTRGSPLALAQANEVRHRLLAAWPELAPENLVIVPMTTTGDRIRDRPLAEVGGKGLFAKEIEEALLAGRIDMAVHSMKDMETRLPEGLEISCLPVREDPRDALIAPTYGAISELPRGATIGSSSLRRRAQVLRMRPDLAVVDLRGNVETRLRKIGAGQADATILANAGLKRLGLAARVSAVLSAEEMLPAVAQGAIGVEQRKDDSAVGDLLAPIHDADAGTCVEAERAFLAALDGSCRTPVAALARLDGLGGIYLAAEVLRPDGTKAWATTRAGAARDAAPLGRDAGEELRRRAEPDIFAGPD